MMQIFTKSRCADCSGTGIQQVPGAFEITCASCPGTGYIEAWLPLSDVFELMARAARESV